VAQVKTRLGTLHPVIRQNHQWIAFGDRIRKGFLIREQFRALNIIKEWAKQNVG